MPSQFHTVSRSHFSGLFESCPEVQGLGGIAYANSINRQTAFHSEKVNLCAYATATVGCGVHLRFSDPVSLWWVRAHGSLSRAGSALPQFPSLLQATICWLSWEERWTTRWLACRLAEGIPVFVVNNQNIICLKKHSILPIKFTYNLKFLHIYP